MSQFLKKSTYLNSDFYGSFNAANNQSSVANITNLLFNSTLTKGFVAWISVYITATANLAEMFELRGVYTGSDWLMSVTQSGNASGIVFTITSGGQVQYTSTNVSGFTSNVINWKGCYTTQILNTEGNVTSVASQTGTGNTFVMSIAPTFTGNVGIGTTNPSTLFHVAGTTGANHLVTIDSTGTNGNKIYMGYNGAISYGIYIAGGKGTASDADFAIENKFYVKGDGNVGIGLTNPTAKLWIVNTYSVNPIAFMVHDENDYGFYNSVGSTLNYNYGRNEASIGYINFRGYANGTTQFRSLEIDNGKQGLVAFFDGTTNRVGICKATPDYQLELNNDSAGKPGAGGLWSVVSDERIKENIIPADLDRCYEIVKSLPLKRGTFKDTIYNNEQVKDRSALMWIAQDVKPFFSKAVSSHTKEFITKPEEKETIELSPSITTKDGKILKEAIVEERIISEKESVIIEDCMDLNSGQIIAAMYGALQKSMIIIEDLQSRLSKIENNNILETSTGLEEKV